MCMLLTLFVEPSYFSYLISYTNGMIIVQNEWHIFIHPGHLEGMEEDRMPKKKKHLHSTGRDEMKEEDPGKDGEKKCKEIFRCWEREDGESW